MTLKQRRTRFDRFLLRVVFPTLTEWHMTPLTGAARLWHTAEAPAASKRPQRAPELAAPAVGATLTARAA
jgi:hypothetical protein